MGLLYVTVTRSSGVEYKRPSHLCLRFPTCGVAKPLAVRAVTSVVVSHRAEPSAVQVFLACFAGAADGAGSAGVAGQASGASSSNMCLKWFAELLQSCSTAN